MATTEIWCLRHGEAANVVAGQMGAVPEAELTRVGYAQDGQSWRCDAWPA